MQRCRGVMYNGYDIVKEAEFILNTAMNRAGAGNQEGEELKRQLVLLRLACWIEICCLDLFTQTLCSRKETELLL